MDLILVFGIKFVQVLQSLLIYALLIHVVLSWFAQGRSKFGMYLEQIVQPILRPFRWARIGMFDLSVIVAFLIIDHGGRYVLKFLASLL